MPLRSRMERLHSQPPCTPVVPKHSPWAWWCPRTRRLMTQQPTTSIHPSIDTSLHTSTHTPAMPPLQVCIYLAAWLWAGTNHACEQGSSARLCLYVAHLLVFNAIVSLGPSSFSGPQQLPFHATLVLCEAAYVALRRRRPCNNPSCAREHVSSMLCRRPGAICTRAGQLSMCAHPQQPVPKPCCAAVAAAGTHLRKHMPGMLCCCSGSMYRHTPSQSCCSCRSIHC